MVSSIIHLIAASKQSLVSIQENSEMENKNNENNIFASHVPVAKQKRFQGIESSRSTVYVEAIY